MAASFPLLVVSDIDGTLLNSRERVTARTREAIARIVREGAVFTLASGRPPRWILEVLEQLPVRPVCVCTNGALVYDSARDRITRAVTLSPGALRSIVGELDANLPGLGFAVERAGESAFDRVEELFAVSPGYDHAWAPEEHAVQGFDELLAEPAVKLLIRDPRVSSAELFERVSPFIDRGLGNPTFSWDGGLVEVSAPGVSKRSALEWIAADVGAGPGETVAFGDMPNDVEMLEWAGLGVAMGNALPLVKGVADEVTLSNDEDGVARVLERWL